MELSFCYVYYEVCISVLYDFWIQTMKHKQKDGYNREKKSKKL